MAEPRLTDTVLDVAENDASLSEDAKLLVLAALDGDAALAGAVGGESPPASPPIERDDRQTEAEEPEPIGAYLVGIEVAGFRGIGPAVTLPLAPGPGLTVVAGRNGSGKSSFAEALEIALTGDSYRWAEKKGAIWSGSWRNMHYDSPCHIRIRLAEEASGETVVGLDWDRDAELGDRKSWVQRAGQKREPSLAALGWGSAIELYRPILSYDELGGLLTAEPSRLHDALEGILGLEQLNEAEKRLTATQKRLQQPDVECKTAKAALKPALEGLDDERAKAALLQLRKTKPDLDEMLRLATGTAPQQDDLLVALRALVHVTTPGEVAVERAAHDLRAAVADMAAHSTRSLEFAEQRAALLDHVLKLHATHGDMPCLVCGEGALDDEWRQRVVTEQTQESEALIAVRDAQRNLTQCRQSARELTKPVLLENTHREVELTSLGRVTAVQRRWVEAPQDDLGLAEHLLNVYPELAEAVSALSAEASASLTQREDKWAPVAQQLAEWVRLKRRALANEEVGRKVQEAVRWVRANNVVLRNQRLEPLADEARAIWAALRQESNVDLGTISLTGQRTRRRVELNATVDDEPAQALTVMSQGELHALALALFLPRATRPASPLRFVVLDDPIQAMDPAKVDGFVRVLNEIARDRQVVVFSHDDRLADAVRQIGGSARVIEVTREAGSVVKVMESSSPARRYVDDALALARDTNVPLDVTAKVLPGLCRLAVEAAARDVYYNKRYSDGADRNTTEANWVEAKGALQKLALAFRDDCTAKVDSWRDAKPARRRTLSTCGGGVHIGISSDPRLVTEDLAETVEDILGGSR
ncbi:AAA domain-containing protein [Amycolatopsis marina]|uniref:Nuclease SbcCD subunit C n=1 Tax=Amycolatopsis marina TaxID=490629 RepID=A0A1I0W6I0_9PSEU|nr:AAA family ATPase [Amycolatopsis marina]SFA84171.1 AAA domain-containing protein [Amycolatopsis marina]